MFFYYMIVCVCKAVSDKDIHAAIDGGHASVRALQKELGAGTGCGVCRCEIKKILQERRLHSSAQSAFNTKLTAFAPIRA